MNPSWMHARSVRGSLLALVASSVLLAGCSSSSGGGLQPPSGLHYANPNPSFSKGTPATPDVPSVTGGAVSSWSVTPTFPAGLVLDPTTGAIQGTPTATAGPTLYTVTASNSAGSTSAGVTITVTSGVTPPSGLTYLHNPVGYTQNQAITPNTPSYSGGQPSLYTVSPALPAGLSLDPATGIISGTPTTPTQQATYTVQASNSGGPPTSVGVVITVSQTPQPILTLSYTSVTPSYVVGTPVQNTPIVTGGQVASYTVSPALPAGLSLNGATGVISGTPTTPSGPSSYVVTATNAANSVQVTLSITVTSSAAAPGTITYPAPPTSYPAGQAIQQLNPSYTGGPPTSWSASPSLPAGLTLNPNTGVISGTPTAVSPSTSYTITGTNSGGSASAAVNISVVITWGQLAVVVDHVPSTDPTVNLSYTAVGSGPYTMLLKARLVGSGGITAADSALINFAALSPGVTFNNTTSTALNCTEPVTSANPECTMLVNLPSASPPGTFNVRAMVAGAITTRSPLYNEVVAVLNPDTTPGPGNIVLSTQGNQIPIGLNAPLWVNWVNPATIGTVTVQLSISGGASFYWYEDGDNLTRYTGATKTCTLVFTGNTGNRLGCGFGLRASDGATPGQAVAITATATGSWGYTYPSTSGSGNVLSLSPTVEAALPATRTVNFTNTSSQTLWVGITGGAATSWSDLKTPYGPPASTGSGRPLGGATQCGPSTKPAPDMAACPLGTTCLQGGASGLAGTDFKCFYDQGTLSTYQVAPGASTQFQVSGSSVSPSGIIWSGNFYGRTGCNTTDPTQAGICQNAQCVGAAAGFGCGPGTGPSPGANTLAEVTFQASPQSDYYDVSIINGANFAVQFGPQGVTGTGYTCGQPGSATALPGGLPGANWTQVVTSANVPVPGQLKGPAQTYFQLIRPDATQPCPSSGICPNAGDSCGFRPSDLTGSFDFATRTCGTKIGWTTADGMFGVNQSSTPTNTPFGFTQTPPSPSTALPVPNVLPTVGELQLCSSKAAGIYSSYTLNWDSPTAAQQAVASACGGVMWGATETPGPNMPVLEPAITGQNIINPSQAVQTVNLNWVTFVQPTILWMKQACPTCYTYPFDDMSSTFTCTDSTGQGLTYQVQFSDLK